MAARTGGTGFGTPAEAVPPIPTRMSDLAKSLGHPDGGEALPKTFRDAVQSGARDRGDRGEHRETTGNGTRQHAGGDGVHSTTERAARTDRGPDYRHDYQHREGPPNGRLSGFPGLMTLSSLMFDSQAPDDILRLLDRGVPELVSCELEACYLRRDGRLSANWPSTGADASLATRVAGLEPDGGALGFGEGVWRWAFPLTSMASPLGYLVLRSETEPSAERRFLIEALCQQAAAALASVSLHRRDRERLAELRRVNDDLSVMVARLEQRAAAHEVLTRVSASGEGEAGIARAAYELTGLPVVVEDAFGNPRHSAGLSEPDAHPPPPSTLERQAFLNRLVAHDGPVRERDRIVSLVRPRGDVLGVLVFLDPEHAAGDYETFVAEHATTELAREMAHQRSLAEVELRVHRDLVDDLVAGTDDESAIARAAAVGHDLRAPHHVVAIRWEHHGTEDAVATAAKRALRSWQRRALVSRRAGVAILLVDGPVDGAALHHALAARLGTKTGTIGVGGRCERPADVPRSHTEAVQSLAVREESASPYGASTFHDLGIYRILGGRHNRADVEGFMRERLGPLLDYDARRHSELVRTLFEYLECGGNYDSAAATLVIHRSTLRYRLARIREIAGLDLADVDTRLNLQVATRAWQLFHGHGPPTGS
jgi:sugar diacid utilization regulator